MSFKVREEKNSTKTYRFIKDVVNRKSNAHCLSIRRFFIVFIFHDDRYRQWQTFVLFALHIEIVISILELENNCVDLNYVQTRSSYRFERKSGH